MSRLIFCNLFLFQIATTLLRKAFQQIKVLFDKFFRVRYGLGKNFFQLDWVAQKVLDHGVKTSTPFSCTRSMPKSPNCISIRHMVRPFL